MTTRILSSLLLCLALGAAAALAVPAPADFDFARLISSQPCLVEVARAARRHGVTFGIYGGTVRDLYLGHPFTVISDYDLIYDSSQKGFAGFREDVLAIGARYRGKVPTPDFHFDLSPRVKETERQAQFHTEGITATKVGLLSDGTLLDPTDLGIGDLRARVFRFYAPKPRPFIDLHNVGRFVRDLVRLHDFRRDPGTMRLLRASLDRAAAPATAEGRRARQASSACREASSTGPILFHALIKPFRKDVRYLHDQLMDRLTSCFPTDVFFFDLLKSVTQADDMPSMREAFAAAGVDRFLAAIGLERETGLLMDPALDRLALFTAFQFPGHIPSPAHRPTALELWESTLRRYNYRSLFDMLASEFSPASRERRILQSRRDDFLRESGYRLFGPGDEYREEILGFLDTDLNVFRLPREELQKSLEWFERTYLPGRERTLEAAPLPPIVPGSSASLEFLCRGYASQVRALATDVPHSMRDLQGYLDFQIGKELRPLFLDRRTTLAFVDGDAAEAARTLASRGFTRIFRVGACGFSRRRQTLLGADPKRDRVGVAFFGYHSDEQLLNEQARFRFLGVPPQSVLTLRRAGGRPFPDRQKLLGLLDQADGPVRVLFVGFTGPLKRLLRGARALDAGDLSLVVGRLADGRVALALSAFGACFGTLPARVAGLLRERGLDTVVFVGSAGSLRGARRRFQWAIPRAVAFLGESPGADREAIPLENRALSLGVQGAIRGTLHGSVWTPLVETAEWAKRNRARGVATVDCELYHLVEELSRGPARPGLYALLNVTDFPDSPRTDGSGITVENAPEQQAMVADVLARIVRELGRSAYLTNSTGGRRVGFKSDASRALRARNRCEPQPKMAQRPRYCQQSVWCGVSQAAQ